MLGLRRFRGQKKSVRARWAVLWQSPAAVSPQARYSVVVRFQAPMEKKEVLDGRCIVSPGLQSHSAVRQRTGSRFSRGADPQDEESSEEDRPFLPRFLLQEIYLLAQLVPAKPAGESSGQIRLASLARNFGDRVHDPPDSRARCFSSMQCVRTAQSPGALLGAIFPVGASASRRFPLAVGFSALVQALGQSRQPEQGAQDRIHDSEPDLWMWDLDVAGDYCPRVSGPVPQPAVSFRPRLLLRELVLAHSLFDPCRSIRGSPLTKSGWLSLRRVAHTECVIIMFQATVNFLWRCAHLKTSSMMGEKSVDSSPI